MVITAAARHHNGGSAEGDGESGWSTVESSSIHQTLPDSTRLEFHWTGLHWTPPDYSPAVLSGSAMDLAGHSVRWSPPESAGVQPDYVGER